MGSKTKVTVSVSVKKSSSMLMLSLPAVPTAVAERCCSCLRLAARLAFLRAAFALRFAKTAACLADSPRANQSSSPLSSIPSSFSSNVDSWLDVPGRLPGLARLCWQRRLRILGSNDGHSFWVGSFRVTVDCTDVGEL